MPHKHRLNTVDAIVDDIIKALSQEDRFRIADLNENQLELLELVIEKFIRYMLDQMDKTVNKELMADCIAKSGNKSLDEIEAAGLIMHKLWERLKEMPRLRVVK